MLRVQFAIVFIFAGIASLPAHAETPPVILQRMFHPYDTEKPFVNGLSPGTQISKDSWEAAKDYLPPEILEKVKIGDQSGIGSLVMPIVVSLIK